MIKRSTWVTVLVLGILAGIAYYMQQPDNLIKKSLASGNTPTAAAPGMLISFADGTVNSIGIQKTGGESLTLQRGTSGWTMTLGSGSPIPADQNSVDQTASNVVFLSLSGKITSPTANPATFGLDKPGYIFTLGLSTGKTVTTKIGNQTVAGDGYYAQKDDGSIVILEKSGFDPILNLLAQPPYMFTLTPTQSAATGTPTPTAALNNTSTPVAGTPTGTPTP